MSGISGIQGGAQNFKNLQNILSQPGQETQDFTALFELLAAAVKSKQADAGCSGSNCGANAAGAQPAGGCQGGGCNCGACTNCMSNMQFR
ncbi:hypothetical protein [Chelativorans sp. Marseille-P2723]|uniref:hypothetical protein n=1 Tax=Chelativorans sp. Marseille-P2723 TaxID=2709133 RepID=UPI0015710445|nr:hypothetical protein [Chelativorans sp. Marseille-P2723]